MDELELDFNRLMRSIYDRAKRECRYSATYFLRMLGEHGGVETAHILLRAPDVSDGFVALYQRGRLDLTVEAQILSNSRFWALFEDQELDTARRWLRRHNWEQA
jgi:hypothetical protein